MSAVDEALTREGQARRAAERSGAGTSGALSRSGRANSLRFAVLLAALGTLVLVCLLSVALGSRSIPLSAVWHVLWQHSDSADAFIIYDLRLPRTMIGLLVGAALGMAGAVMQALTRNPLADPGLLGLNMGASAAVVVAIVFLGVTSPSGYVWFAFLGAGVAAIAVYSLGSAGRAATPERMVLAGVAVAATLTAFVMGVLLLKPLAFDQFRFWTVGSLAGRRMDTLVQVAPFLLIGIALALALARPLNALLLGDEAGRALGSHIERTRLLGAVAVTLLCGAATAAAGPIGFVGLAVPFVARLIAGPDLRWVLPYSMVLAPILLLGSDIVGRLIVSPSEVEVHIITAFVGAPVFIALCRRRKIAQL